MKDYIITELKKKYIVNELDLGKLKRFKKGLSKVEVKANDVIGIGRCSTVEIKSLFNSVQLQMIILKPEYKDVPMLIYKHMDVMGQQTLIMQLVNMSVNTKSMGEFKLVNQRYDNLTDYDLGATFADSLLLDCSISKRQSKSKDQYYKYSREYINCYLRLIDGAPECSKDFKNQKVKEYLDGLMEHLDSYCQEIRNCIGEEQMKLLYKKYLFNCED